MRLIDADALIALIKKRIKNSMIIGWLCSIIRDAPTIDAVPVVRCKDCKKGEIDDPDFPGQYYCHAGCGWNNEGFYCAYGKRKEGADNG